MTFADIFAQFGTSVNDYLLAVISLLVIWVSFDTMYQKLRHRDFR